jgi:hypothetical protein
MRVCKPSPHSRLVEVAGANKQHSSHAFEQLQVKECYLPVWWCRNSAMVAVMGLYSSTLEHTHVVRAKGAVRCRVRVSKSCHA